MTKLRRIRHRIEFFDEKDYGPVRNNVLAGLFLGSVACILVGIPLTVSHWFAWWTLAFYVVPVLLSVEIMAELTYEAAGMSKQQRNVYAAYRGLNKASREPIKLDPEVLKLLTDDECVKLHGELLKVKEDEDRNAEIHRKVNSDYASTLARVEEQRSRLALDTRKHEDAHLYDGWTTAVENPQK